VLARLGYLLCDSDSGSSTLRATSNKFPACKPGHSGTETLVSRSSKLAGTSESVCIIGPGAVGVPLGTVPGQLLSSSTHSPVESLIFFFQTFPSGSKPGRPVSHTQNFHDSK
jgi:hypothetical protein